MYNRAVLLDCDGVLRIVGETLEPAPFSLDEALQEGAEILSSHQTPKGLLLELKMSPYSQDLQLSLKKIISGEESNPSRIRDIIEESRKAIDSFSCSLSRAERIFFRQSTPEITS